MRQRRMNVRDIGRRLGAHFVVSGSLRIDGQRVAVMVELADSSKGSVLWADRFAGDVRELTSIEAPMTNRIASAVCEAVLVHEFDRVHRQPLPTLESYSLLLAGVSLMHRFGVEDFNRAQRCLAALIERVPRHSEPYAWMARWHVLRAVQGWSEDRKLESSKARDLCRRALDLDPGSAHALTVAGSAHIALDKDIDLAQERYNDALRANPNEPLAWVLLGTSHSFKGEGEDALRCCSRALSLTPLDPIRFFYDNHTAAAAVAAGDYEMGIELATRSLRANRTHHSTLRVLAIAQSLAGRLDDARKTVQRILVAQPDLTVESFQRNSPASDNAHGRRLAEALRAAGLPN
jgi:tetratricopeptide (TPR) repeat protein